jgi:hypothetical protein
MRPTNAEGKFEHATPWLAASAILLHLAVSLRVISARPLWNDEIFTMYLCRLPGMASVWRALETGLEQMPPFSHIVSRAAYRWAGGDALAIRLPALIGFTAMAVCLYVFASRRLPRTYALIAMLVPFFTGAFHFGYEARSYGVVLGCAGAAIVAWQAAEGRWRALALPCLALACAAAIASHYYAVLILAPLALGEIVRTIQRRKLDVLVWAALAASLAPLAFFLPLIRASRSYATNFWAKPGLTSLQDAYGRLIAIGLPVFIGLALMWLVYFMVARARASGIPYSPFAADLAVAAGFLALPAAAVALSFITGAFEPRYAIWGVIGIALGIAYAAYLSTSGSLVFGAVASAYLLAAFAFIEAAQLHKTRDLHPAALERVERLSGAGLPVVYADPLRYLEAAYYAPPEVNQRLFYVAEPAAALRRAGTDTPERALLLLSRIAPLHIVSLCDFTRGHRRFLVIESGEFSWLVPELAGRGASVSVKDGSGDARTYEVSIDRAETATRASSAPTGGPP